MSEPAGAITSAIRNADGPALCAYVTGGYPGPDEFGPILSSIAEAADVVEIGVPFTDPMADGQTIQQASHHALTQGANLDVIFAAIEAADLATPHVFMGYYNPFLAYGFDRLVSRMVEVGTSGLIVPDLPLEESAQITGMLEPHGLGLVQMVAPTTPPDRLAKLTAASRGFVYAVTTKGTTGRATTFDSDVLAYLDRVTAVSELPVIAGFGVRERSHVAQLRDHVDGVAVGTALIDAIDAGDDVGEFLRGLRPVGVAG